MNHSEKIKLFIVLCVMIPVLAGIIAIGRVEIADASQTQQPAFKQPRLVDVNLKTGKWGHLAEYIGRYDYKSVLDDEHVHAELKALLGEGEMEHLFANLGVRGGIGFDRDCLILRGNYPHKGGVEQAFVNICLSTGGVHAAILSETNITIYTRASEYRYLPKSLRYWVYFNAPERERFKAETPNSDYVSVKRPE